MSQQKVAKLSIKFYLFNRIETKRTFYSNVAPCEGCCRCCCCWGQAMQMVFIAQEAPKTKPTTNKLPNISTTSQCSVLCQFWSAMRDFVDVVFSRCCCCCGGGKGGGSRRGRSQAGAVYQSEMPKCQKSHKEYKTNLVKPKRKPFLK